MRIKSKILVFALSYLASSITVSGELHDAITKNTPHKAIKLIENGASIDERNEYGDSPLYLASLRGQVNVVKALISKGANINSISDNGENALHAAADKERAEIAKLLLDAGIDPALKNKYGDTPLDFYSGTNHPVANLIKQYLKK